MKNLKQQITNLIDASKYNEAADLFIKTLGVKIKKDWLKYDYHFADDKQQRHIFKIKISRGRKSYSFNFGQSIKNDANEPSNYSILACLQKCEVGTFENFCDHFGYDEDSRKAEKIYKAVLEEFAGMRHLFSSEELEILAEIN